ncbi:glutathione S-transferase 1-like [Paramacrobiotus metropolitanus]|uniref:glutathione S-transferase 1-like n=1 Tax=Paramacrobiotus metropolitanus TaxID=2943436 RepID=UPI002445EF81|nr:glutathione S-transferase 1-like [Paramacrobiotus metropolitanus]
MPQSFKLVYFDGRGRAELLRLTFVAANRKFEDVRVDVMGWPSLRTTTPWGTLPLLEVDGRTVAQSNAIARYLARSFLLAGQDKWQEVLVDSVIEAASDFLAKILHIGEFKGNDLEKADAVHKFKEVTVPSVLSNFDRFISQHGNNGFTVGNHMTIADIAIFSVLDNLFHHGILDSQSLEHYPGVKAAFKSVKTQPRIAAYLNERPNASF